MPAKEITDHLLKYFLPDDSRDTEKKSNPITAEEVAEEVMNAIKRGKAVEIKSAIIKGRFILKGVTDEGDVSIQRTKFTDAID
jgi:hypothetical protein